MKSLFTDELLIGINKHSDHVNRWRWCLIDPWHYGLTIFGSSYDYTSSSDAMDAFTKFAEINNLTNFKFQQEQ